MNAYTERAKAFGWHTIQIDGHDFKEIDAAYTEALNIKNMPTLIVAKTIKGKGNIEIEDMDGFHGKPLENIEAAIEQLGGIRNIKIDVNTFNGTYLIELKTMIGIGIKTKRRKSGIV